MVALSVIGEEAPTQEKGFFADRRYSFGEIDHVNLFNGNLIITLPIGQSYPVNGDLTYGLNLVYNSKVWQTESVPNGQTVYRRAVPVYGPNAGLGWTMTMGSFYAGCVVNEICEPTPTIGYTEP